MFRFATRFTPKNNPLANRAFASRPTHEGTPSNDPNADEKGQENSWEKFLKGNLPTNDLVYPATPNQWKEKEENRKLKPSDPSDLGYWS